MNKIVIIKIVLESLLLFANNKLNYSIFSYILKRHNGISISEDEYIYWESKLLDEIFTKIPYYKVEPTLENYLDFLNNYPHEELRDLKTIKLIISYIDDIRSIIRSKINIEIIFHIGVILDTPTLIKNVEIAKMFFQENLKRYTSSSYVSNTQAQYKIFDKEKISLRDELSKKRYNQRSSLRANAEKKICSKFNSESFSEFRQTIDDILEDLLKDNPKENKSLIIYYNAVLTELEEKCEKKLNENSSKYKELQKNLIFITCAPRN